MMKQWFIAVIVVASFLCGALGLRLVPNGRCGRLEIRHNNTWNTFCSKGFLGKAATVACRELNLSGQHNVIYSAEGGSGPIWLNGSLCQGQETTLSLCKTTPLISPKCNHSDDVGLCCSSEKLVKIIPGDSVLRLLENERETIKCKISDDIAALTVVSYYWSSNERIISTSSTYTVTGSAARNGLIKCTVSDTAGHVLGRASTFLNVQHPPKPFHLVKFVIEGQLANICMFRNINPRPHMFKWKKSGLSSSWETTGTCPVLNPVHRSDAGLYVMYVTNTMTNSFRGTTQVGTALQNVTLSVLYAPNVTCPQEISIDLNATVVLNCNIDASPTVHTIKWTLNSTSIYDLNGQDRQYRIVNANYSDSGTYVCEATNSMKDYSGHYSTGTGECSITVIVTAASPPLSVFTEDGTASESIWLSSRFHIIGTVIAVIILTATGVLVFIVVKRSSSCKETFSKRGQTTSDKKKVTNTAINNLYSTDQAGFHQPDGMIWSEVAVYGDSYSVDSDGEWDQYDADDPNNGHHYGNVDKDYPDNRKGQRKSDHDVMHVEDSSTAQGFLGIEVANDQPYGNVCFDEDVYQNVSVKQMDMDYYENTEF